MVKSLAPKGNLRRAVSAVCGVAMMAAMLSILGEIEDLRIGKYVLRYREDAEQYVGEALREAKTETRFIIEERCEAYILDKAEALGVPVESVSVTAGWSEEGFWYPVSCEIRGDESRELRLAVEAELGIPGEEQIWSTKDEG